MGPKRNANVENGKIQSPGGAVDVESDTKEDDLRHTIQHLEEQLNRE